MSTVSRKGRHGSHDLVTCEPYPGGPVPERNRLEIVRFPSTEARRQAIRVLLDAGLLELSSSREEEWLVRTPVARALRERGVPFDWLTEHA